MGRRARGPAVEAEGPEGEQRQCPKPEHADCLRGPKAISQFEEGRRLDDFHREIADAVGNRLPPFGLFALDQGAGSRTYGSAASLDSRSRR